MLQVRVTTHAYSSDATGSVELFSVMSATFGPELPKVSSNKPNLSWHALIRGDLSSDCSRMIPFAAVGTKTNPSLELKDAAVLVGRGGPCSFVHKVYAAQQQGASLAIVADTILGAVASSQVTGLPIYNCELGAAIVEENATQPLSCPQVGPIENSNACTGSSTCFTRTCVYTGMTGRQHKGFQVCCFQNTLIRMAADPKTYSLAKKIVIPSIF